MLSEPRAKHPGGWIASACLVAAAACAGSVAQAQVTFSSSAGTLHFPNVTIVNTPLAPAAMPVAPNGFKAYVDPATGQLTSAPTDAQVDALDALASPRRTQAKRASPKPYMTKDGAVGLVLDEDSLMYAVARRSADNTIDWACVEDGTAAIDYLTGRVDKDGHSPTFEVKGRAVK